jgi:UPF0755 protein
MLPRIADQLPGITTEDLQAVLSSGQLDPRYRPETQTSWEGLLFASTYEVDDEATAFDVLKLMSDEFARVASELGYGAADTALGLNLDLTAYDVIIVASMIEAEAKVDEDRAKIARVIYNRLEQDFSIDIDATCIYGSGDRQVGLTREYMETGAGEYACRNFRQLPPTPISTPSEDSLAAAINPEDGDWLYYVLMDAEGHHLFTETLEEFNEQKVISEEQGLLG